MNPDNVDEQMDAVLKLMNQRAKGEATNAQVEAAIAQLLHREPTTAGDVVNAAEGTGPTKQTKESEIQLDTENEQKEDRTQPTLHERQQQEPTNGGTATGKRANEPEIEPDTENYDEEEVEKPPPKKKKRGRPPKNKPTTDEDITEVDWSLYEDILLGKQGAQMLTTFGDGKHPKPAAVQAVLNGARRMLQVAIQDARHIRRKQNKIYKDAQGSVHGERKPNMKSETNIEILYRANTGYDPLAYLPKCGFGMSDLRELYPEEINAYTHWNELHSEANVEDDELDDSRQPATETPAQQKPDPGHLQERAAHFDHRTQHMPDDWYFKYSVIRQGSFLPRRRKDDGKPQGWSNARTTRFLHWIGFDPNSALPPPTDETSSALAFLGYDFVGRIVEKALVLRSLAKQKREKGTADESIVVVELDEGDQLDVVDIENAMESPDIKPVPLYSSAPDKKKQGHLYFGAGFENRLEMEMEEMLNNNLTEEERKIREEEESLFAGLAEKEPSPEGPQRVAKKPAPTKRGSKKKKD